MKMIYCFVDTYKISTTLFEVFYLQEWQIQKNCNNGKFVSFVDLAQTEKENYGHLFSLSPLFT